MLDKFDQNQIKLKRSDSLRRDGDSEEEEPVPNPKGLSANPGSIFVTREGA